MKYNNITLIDIIDKNMAELIQMGFNEKVRKTLNKDKKLSIAMTIVGKMNGEYYRIPDGNYPDWTGYCSYIRNCINSNGEKSGDKLCCDCDVIKAEEYFCGESDSWQSYTCHAGLIDIAIPIMIGGKAVAVFFGGQKRLKNSHAFNEELFNKINILAEKIPELNKLELLRLVDEVPELTEKEIENHAIQLSEIALYISDLARRNFEARKTISMMAKFSEEYLKRRLPLKKILLLIFREVCSFLSVEQVILIRFSHINSIIAYPKLSGDIIIENEQILNDISKYFASNIKTTKNAVYLTKDSDYSIIEKINNIIRKDKLNSIFINFVDFSVSGTGLFLFLNPKLDRLEVNQPEMMTKRCEFVHDLSERLKNAIDIYELDQQKDELMAEVTHRLKSPMQWLLSETSTMLPRFDSLKNWINIEPKILESLNKIKDIVSFIDAQIKNYIIITTMDKDDISYDKRMHPIGKLIEICTEQFRQLAVENKVDLKVNIDKKCFERILFDWDQIQVVIHNLFDNAIKYSHRKQTVVVSARIDDTNNLCRIKFSSYGIGIAPEEKDLIFQKFRRGEIMKDPRRFIPGTGIGLTVARKIARDHGGDVVLLECKQGEGEVGRGHCEEGWKVDFELSLAINKKEEKN